MENSNKSAFAFTDGEGRPVIGLTKREYFAGLAMQGILANAEVVKLYGKNIAKQAILYSDELLKQLEK